MAAWLLDIRRNQIRVAGAVCRYSLRCHMRLRYAITVAAVILVGFGVKLFFFSAPAAEADMYAVKNGSMNVFQLDIDHPNIKTLPALDVKDPI
jgi:hypothetical protein